MTWQSQYGLRANFQGLGAGAGGGGGSAGVNDPTHLLGLPIDTSTPPVAGQTITFNVTTQTWAPGTITGLSPINSGYVMANATGLSAVPVGVSLSSLFDFVFGNTQGVILYRNAAAWVVLAPGTSGQLLQSGGTAANVSWVTPAASSGGSMLPLVNGDLPGPAAISDDKGQYIGVPL